VEKIYQHIEKLLGRNEYVVVPGIGGFVLQQQSAQIIDTILTAPRKVISFNALMHHDDGLLVIEIARTERISYRKALEMLQSKTSVFQQQLRTSGSFVFGNLGTFRFSAEHTFVFEPERNAAFIPSNIGLKDLYLTDYSKKHIQFTNNSSQIISTRSFLRYAAVFVLLFSLMFIAEQKHIEQNTQSASIIHLNVYVPAPLSQNDSDTFISKNLKAVSSKTESVVETTNLSDSSYYHVVVASMPTQESAEYYCQLLRDKNIKTARILAPARTYKVAIKSFENRDEAIAYMENLRQSDPIFATAWVYCQK